MPGPREGGSSEYRSVGGELVMPTISELSKGSLGGAARGNVYEFMSNGNIQLPPSGPAMVGASRGTESLSETPTMERPGHMPVAEIF